MNIVVTVPNLDKNPFFTEEIIKRINKLGKVIPTDDIIKEAETRGISATKVEESIEKLKRSGDIFEPKPGFISRL